MKRLELVVCRHGQTDLNAQGRCMGGEDVSLNEVGRGQAQALAEKIAVLEPRPKAVIASDLNRARETAEFIGGALELPVKTDPRLREVDVGLIGSTSMAEVKRKYPELWKDDSGINVYDFRPVGGESRDQVLARQAECLRDIMDEYGLPDDKPVSSVVIVGHVASLEALLAVMDVSPPKVKAQGKYQVVAYTA